MKSLLKKKGFTLIEILIVVVIIGILASLILPRMLAQPERVITAEAINYLGVIKRAQETNAQPGGTFVTASSGIPGGTPDAGWTRLGFDPLPSSASFTYSCTSSTPIDADGDGTISATELALAGNCTATRVGAATTARGTGTITMSMTTGYIIACDQTKYKLSGTSGTSDARCA